MRVALIGAGRMGSAMGGRVAAAGHDLVVFNRTRSRAEDLAGQTNARVADSAREAAEFAEVCLAQAVERAAVHLAVSADHMVQAGAEG